MWHIDALASCARKMGGAPAGSMCIGQQSSLRWLSNVATHSAMSFSFVLRAHIPKTDKIISLFWYGWCTLITVLSSAHKCKSSFHMNFLNCVFYLAERVNRFFFIWYKSETTPAKISKQLCKWNGMAENSTQNIRMNHLLSPKVSKQI